MNRQKKKKKGEWRAQVQTIILIIVSSLVRLASAKPLSLASPVSGESGDYFTLKTGRWQVCQPRHQPQRRAWLHQPVDGHGRANRRALFPICQQSNARACFDWALDSLARS